MYLVKSRASVSQMNSVSRGSIVGFIRDAGSVLHCGWHVMVNDRGSDFTHTAGASQNDLHFAGEAGTVMVAKDKSTMIEALKACGSGSWNSRDVGPIVILNGSYRGSTSKDSLSRALHQPLRGVHATWAQVKHNAKLGMWNPIRAQSHDIKRNMLQDRGYFVAVTGQSVVNSAMNGIHIHFAQQDSISLDDLLHYIR